MTAPVMLRRRLPAPDPYGFQDAAAQATNATASRAGYDLRQTVGKMLGNLNGIGALRSGGASAGIADAAHGYSDAVSQAAAANALQAQIAGAQAGQADKQMTNSNEQAGLSRASQEKQFADQLAFQREANAQDYGFKEHALSSEENRAQADRAQALGISQAELASREKMAGEDLGFQRSKLEQEGSQFGQDLGFKREAMTNEYGFKNKELGQNQSQFTAHEAEARRQANKDYILKTQQVNQEEAHWRQERQDQIDAANKKRHSGVLGFVGKALGYGIGAIVGGPAGALAGGKIAGGLIGD